MGPGPPVERRQNGSPRRPDYLRLAEEAYRLFLEEGRRPETILRCWERAETYLREDRDTNCRVR